MDLKVWYDGMLWTGSESGSELNIGQMSLELVDDLLVYDCRGTW